MHAGGGPSWVIRENASRAVLLALYLREVLSIASPVELPRLRDVGPVGDRLPTDRQDALERQWREWWAMTVEPEAHPSPVPLDLVPAYDTEVALPTTGAEELAAAIVPHAEAARAWAEWAHDQYRTASASRRGDSYRAYAGSIAEHEREVGRRAHSFELNVEVMPLQGVGVWWIGSMTVAVTDSLRSDAAAFDDAIHPIIAELA
ncbi:zinc-binding alcohol dehydrogenase [Agromyces sp. CFH 90414]|uniref:Zinc-binding alcohol dehydrogenase n=1 Tax=Agromyces agglutinans TaxID=2662258 RepID=A0A6I2FDY3_9MICO|nr:zinc-binding alcohol dehydrogenase [Agromyces agglutinans]MRG59308.1 zinc-binding alcohol dehydrogenase [Agromyces agglutinans]